MPDRTRRWQPEYSRCRREGGGGEGTVGHPEDARYTDRCRTRPHGGRIDGRGPFATHSVGCHISCSQSAAKYRDHLAER